MVPPSPRLSRFSIRRWVVELRANLVRAATTGTAPSMSARSVDAKVCSGSILAYEHEELMEPRQKMTSPRLPTLLRMKLVRM